MREMEKVKLCLEVLIVFVVPPVLLVVKSVIGNVFLILMDRSIIGVIAILALISIGLIAMFVLNVSIKILV